MIGAFDYLVSVTRGQLARLDTLIERLMELRDLLEGDTDLEDDNEDRCEAEEDPAIDCGACLPPPLRGPGDPDDAEDGGDAEGHGGEWCNPGVVAGPSLWRSSRQR